jgi:hypothetical protein
VRDRLSFCRVCRLPLDVKTPDHAPIRRFRQTIGQNGDPSRRTPHKARYRNLTQLLPATLASSAKPSHIVLRKNRIRVIHFYSPA